MAGLAGMGISTPPQFDGSNVNDQLGSTLNKGGLLMRMAQSKGQGIASHRGLSNSTIGIDAAQRAMVDAALPIAQQNAQQTHQRVMQGSDQQQQITMLDKQQGWQGNQNSLDRQQQLNMQSNQFGQDKNMSNLNASLQKQRDDLLYQQQLGTLDAQGKQRLQELDKQFETQSALNTQQNQFSAGQSALDRQQQTSILDKQQSFQSGQSALDRNQQLTMQSNEFKNQSALTNQQAQLQQQRDQLLYQQQIGTLDKQGQLQLQELDKQLSNQQALNNQQFGQQKQLNEQQAYLQAERDGLLYKQSLGTLDAQGKQRLQELDKQFETQSALNTQQNTYNSAEAQKDRAQQLIMLEKNASKDLAYMAQQVAANTHGMYLSAIDSQVTSYNERIAALEADQTIKTTDKPAMKAGMEKELNATLQMYGTLYSNINTIRPDWTQFPTKELPKVGAGQTTGTVVAPIKPKTPTSGEAAARTTGTKPPVGTMLPTNVAAPIKPKTPTSGEVAARSPKKIAAPIRQLDNRR